MAELNAAAVKEAESPSLHLLQRTLLYFAVFLSGFAALLNEVMWQKYLATLLGHQAWATAIVFSILLGGMSLGYLLFGRLSRRRLLPPFHFCAVLEIVLAAWAFAFPFFYHLSFQKIGYFYSHWGLNNTLVDLLFSLLLIGIPSLLFGGTLPLLTEGVKGRVHDLEKSHRKLYGWNTIGGAAGAFLAGYVLLPMLPLGSCLFVGGVLNLFVALCLFAFFPTASLENETHRETLHSRRIEKRDLGTFLVSFFSGFLVIALESILIRLVGLSLGTSQYSFSLVLSLFVFALGLGSLLSRYFGNSDPRKLYWLLCGQAALWGILFLTVSQWSYWVHVIRVLIRDIPQAFVLYHSLIAIFFLALLILPVTLSGAILPFCFRMAYRGRKEAGYIVGQVYGVNTVGAVLGSWVGGYVLLYFWNMDQIWKIVVFSSLVSTALAGYLFDLYRKEGVWRLAAPCLIAVGVYFSPAFKYERFLQAFRQQAPTEVSFQGASAFTSQLNASTRLLIWKDGPDSSIGIGASPAHGAEASRTIYVNGKSDGNTLGDAVPALLLGHIPSLLAPSIERVAVVGFGTGMTVAASASYSEVKKVDVIEISETVIAAARNFDAYNSEVTNNKKVEFHSMDAFRFFQGSSDKFGFIVSEPSNPWMSGVENLYSEEFYHLVSQRLLPDGLFGQWIHTYSFNNDLLRMVMRTMRTQFKHVSLFQLKGTDFLLVGSSKPLMPQGFEAMRRRMSETPVAVNLKYLGVEIPEVIAAMEVIPDSAVEALARGQATHTLVNPKLGARAVKAFFSNSYANVHELKRTVREYPLSFESSLFQRILESKPVDEELRTKLKKAFCETPGTRNTALCTEVLFLVQYNQPRQNEPMDYPERIPERVIASFEKIGKKNKTIFTEADLLQVFESYEAYKRYRSPVARLPLSLFTAQLGHCVESVPRDSDLFGECLLQLILVVDGFSEGKEQFALYSQNFFDWVSEYPKEREKFSRFKNAEKILRELVDNEG